MTVTRDAMTLTASLARHRRRWSLTRSVPPASVALVIAASAVAAGAPGAWMLALAVSAAAIAIAMRVPSLERTAVELDRRMRLEDRLTTALQFTAADDAVSMLVVRDGAARIQSLHPANAFPVEFPRAAKTAMAIAVAAAGLLALRGQGTFLDWGGEALGINVAAGTPARAESASRAANTPSSTAVPRDSARPVTQIESAGRPLSLQPADRNAASGDGATGNRARETAATPAGTVTSGARDTSRRGAGIASVDRSSDIGAGGVGAATGQGSQASRDVPIDLRAYVRKYFAVIHARNGE